jgi:transcription-repair coupling factor (superfamily II helicase)
MYKRIAGAETDAALTDVRAELEDRYGPPPESVLHLLAAGEIRLACERLGIALLERKRIAVDVKAQNTAKPAARPAAPAQTAQRPGAPFAPYERQWNAGTAPRPPLAGRHGQAPQTANLQFSTRTVINRTETNATRAAREATAARALGSPLAQAGRIAPMRDMLFLSFSEKLHAAPAEEGKGVNPGLLMKLVAKNAKAGAQLTPQGVLKWPLSASDADTVLRETRELLAELSS